ncbi:hypothetical protein [Bacillus infantis]|uniref:hypothetical protein n=1 Tax=Bacillus infantis TaxID=324767 RepID=UPI003CF365E9
MKNICRYCGEETGYTEGYTVFQAFDGKWGHRYCVEKYDNKHKTEELFIQEQIEGLKVKRRNMEIELVLINQGIEELQSKLKIK